jgi:hypothetical protein
LSVISSAACTRWVRSNLTPTCFQRHLISKRNVPPTIR